jgi:hypothetical protein
MDYRCGPTLERSSHQPEWKRGASGDVRRLVGVFGTRRGEIVPESKAFTLEQSRPPTGVGTWQVRGVVAQLVQCPENSGRLSSSAILSRPQRRQADSQGPCKLCLTDPECASQADERIVGPIELPEADPRTMVPHLLTLIEFFPLSKPIPVVKCDDNRQSPQK